MAGFAVNSPTFPEATLTLGDHKVQIHAPGAPQRQFIRDLSVDGRPVRNWWIPWSELRSATNVSYSLLDQEQKSPGELPPSFAAQQTVGQADAKR